MSNSVRSSSLLITCDLAHTSAKSAHSASPKPLVSFCTGGSQGHRLDTGTTEFYREQEVKLGCIALSLSFAVGLLRAGSSSQTSLCWPPAST